MSTPATATATSAALTVTDHRISPPDPAESRALSLSEQPARPSMNRALLGVPDLIEGLARTSGRPISEVLLSILRAMVCLIVQPSAEGTEVPAPGLMDLIESFKAGRRLSGRLSAGATLRFDGSGAGPRFVLTDTDGREVAAAQRPGELALLLDALSGRSIRRRGVIIKAGPWARRAAAVRYRGESLTTMYTAALKREIEAREQAIGVDLSALDDDGEDIARDALALMPGTVQ